MGGGGPDKAKAVGEALLRHRHLGAGTRASCRLVERADGVVELGPVAGGANGPSQYVEVSKQAHLAHLAHLDADAVLLVRRCASAPR